jgi:thiamine pyrophosphate-dependent acetolactate synthase large subunit-like protein
VDVRSEQIGRRAPVDLGVVGDVRATLETLVPLIKGKRDRAYLHRAMEHYRKARKGLDDLAGDEKWFDEIVAPKRMIGHGLAGAYRWTCSTSRRTRLCEECKR